MQQSNWYYRDSDAEMIWTQLGVGGINVLTRENYYKSGGFDPRHFGWGFEDTTFFMAMETLVSPVHWIEADALHLWHPTSRNPETDNFKNSMELCKKYEAARGDIEAMVSLITERPYSV